VERGRAREKEAGKEFLRSLTSNARLIIAVPSRDRRGRPLPRRTRLQTQGVIEAAMLDACGGATTLRGVGLWRNESGEVVRERIVVVISYLPDLVSPAQVEAVRRCILHMFTAANQESIFAVVNERPFLVRPSDASGANEQAA